ncbi:polyprotein of retroviral origin, putative [Ixodes scapularis]|uniref:RNA-directed DNA polymerase n=1 Tax=Ixodes scapularis TaxID=6945 RepID=B7QH81_IXOSC|nr:polyprotein of retroviral origin, putative [Ixodes scapularis]|eukprot:XP_002414538.1 polyprotein of retroviral origin, putative [Ixodes scapularis]
MRQANKTNVRTYQSIHKTIYIPLADEVRAIREFPQPTSLRKLREFLGLINFHRRFIPHCAEMIQPMTDFLRTKKGPSSAVPSNAEAASAFSNVKEALANAALLFYLQPGAPTRLMTDASSTVAGTVLQQMLNGEWRTLVFFFPETEARRNTL